MIPQVVEDMQNEKIFLSFV